MSHCINSLLCHISEEYVISLTAVDEKVYSWYLKLGCRLSGASRSEFRGTVEAGQFFVAGVGGERGWKSRAVH